MDGWVLQVAGPVRTIAQCWVIIDFTAGIDCVSDREKRHKVILIVVDIKIIASSDVTGKRGRTSD